MGRRGRGSIREVVVAHLRVGMLLVGIQGSWRGLVVVRVVRVMILMMMMMRMVMLWRLKIVVDLRRRGKRLVSWMGGWWVVMCLRMMCHMLIVGRRLHAGGGLL